MGSEVTAINDDELISRALNGETVNGQVYTPGQLVFQFGEEKVLRNVPASDVARRREIAIAREILSNDHPGILYTHFGFCLTSLPHKDPGNPNNRKGGRKPKNQDVLPLPDMQAQIAAPDEPSFELPVPNDQVTRDRQVAWKVDTDLGTLKIFPDRNSLTEQYHGVPYGVAAKMMLCWAQTEALRNNSPVIRCGDNMHDWIGRMGLTRNSQMKNNVREQLMRIASCRFSFVRKFKTIVRPGEVDPVSGARVPKGQYAMADAGDWQDMKLFEKVEFVGAWDEKPKRGQPWITALHLNSTFFETLKVRGVPFREDALKKLSTSPTQVDLYLWLVYRCHALETETPLLSWHKLAAQFGSKHPRQFKQKFPEHLNRVLLIYPEAKVKMYDGGIVLCPSPAPLPQLEMGRYYMSGPREIKSA